jgi:riboflavin biosynthesis pyrimidine reductase
MVGAGTVIADDLQLTALSVAATILAVIIDGRSRVPLGARALTKEAATGTLRHHHADEPQARYLRRRGISI